MTSTIPRAQDDGNLKELTKIKAYLSSSPKILFTIFKTPK